VAGRVPRLGSGVYNLTKHGVVVTRRRRVSINEVLVRPTEEEG
jgi:hypothetical protein